MIRDRNISSKWVHVERIIGLAKTYKILKNLTKHTESLLATEITFVCFMLTNFRKSIVPKIPRQKLNYSTVNYIFKANICYVLFLA